MSELYMVIGGRLPVVAHYDYDEIEDTVDVCAVYVNDANIIDILNHEVIGKIQDYIFDSFDKELQEPDYEYIEG